jgi:hypothetical protein
MRGETRAYRRGNEGHTLYVSGGGRHHSPTGHRGSSRGTVGGVRDSSGDATRNGASLDTSPDWFDRYNRAVIVGSGIVIGATAVVTAVLR